MRKISDDAQRVEGQAMFKILAHANELEARGRKILHFEIGEPDFATPDFITAAGIKALDDGETKYVNSLGILDLRQAIQAYIDVNYGYHPDIGQILVCPGANPVIYFVLKTVANPGDEIIVQDPGFPTYYSAIKYAGLKAVTVPLQEENEFRMNPQEIRNKITKKTRLIIVNSPQNPTGAVMKQNEIKEIFNIAREYDLYLLSDEIYGKMTYDQSHHSATIYDQCKEHTIMLNGFSKSYAMTGWRLGYALGPVPVIEKMGLILQTILSCVPPFVQRAGIAALTGDQEIVSKMMEEFRRRRDLMLSGLNNLPGVKCIKPEGAFYLFPNIKGTGMTSEEFGRFMLTHAGVAVCPGNFFGPGGEGFARFSYASPLIEIEEALEKMSAALREKV